VDKPYPPPLTLAPTEKLPARRPVTRASTAGIPGVKGRSVTSPAVTQQQQTPDSTASKEVEQQESIMKPTVETYDAAVRLLKKAQIIKKEADVQNLGLLASALKQHSVTLRSTTNRSQLQASDMDAKIFDAIALIIEEHGNGYIAIQSSLQNQFTQALGEVTTGMKDELMKGLSQIKDATNEAVEAVTNAARQVHDTVSAKTNHFSQQTYAAIAEAARNTEPQNGKYRSMLTQAELGKVALEWKRIKLKLDADGKERILGKTDQEVKTMAQKALEDMGAGPEVQIRMATLRIGAGTVILEMLNDGSKEWIRTEGRIDKLAKAMGSSVSTPLCWNKVDFVPVEFDVTHDLDEVCQANQISRTDIERCAWMKNPANRRTGQRVATLKMAFRDPRIANRMATEGTIIYSAYRKTEKLDPEPTICYNCQGIGHMAAGCMRKSPICGNCSAEGHTDSKTTPCPNQDKRRCALCNVDGHSAKDPNCPTRQRKRVDMRERIPGYGSKLHLTEEPYTWILERSNYHRGEERPTGTYEGIEPAFRPNSQWEAKHAGRQAPPHDRQPQRTPQEERELSFYGDIAPRTTPAPFPMPQFTEPSQPAPSFPPGNQMNAKGKRDDGPLTIDDSWDEDIPDDFPRKTQPANTQAKRGERNPTTPQSTFPPPQ
jgi:gas vesicle protein